MSIENYFDKLINQLFRKIKYPINVFEREVTELKLSNDDIKRYRFQKLKKDFFSITFKNKDDSFKYLFYLLMAVLLFFIPAWSFRSGISEQEIHAQQQAEALYAYFAGENLGTVDLTSLQNHPQIVDFVCCCICKWFHIDSVYHFRHLIGGFFAWALILLTGSLLMNLFQWRAAFFGAVFLFVSPHFLGQSFGNLTDIPFAFFYLFCIYQLYLLLGEFPILKWKRLLLITLSIIIATYIHSGGYVLLYYLYFFAILIYLIRNPLKKFFTKRYLKNLLFLLGIMVGITVIVYIFIILLPPFYIHHSGVLPSKAIAHSTLNQPVHTFLWNGEIVSSDTLTWKFIFNKMQLTVPLVIILGCIIHLLFVRTIVRNIHFTNELLIVFALVYPLWSLQGNAYNLQDGWSLYLMIYPFVIIYAASGYEGILEKVNDRYTNIVIVGAISLLLIMPLRHTLLYKNRISTYFNEISGGIHNAQNKCALDADESCNQKICNWLIQNVKEQIYVDTNGYYIPYIVATNGNAGCDYFFRHVHSRFQLCHADWNTLDSSLLWDYYISFIDRASEQEIQEKLTPQDSIIYQITVERQPIAFIVRRNYLTDTLINTDTIPLQDTLISYK